MAWWRPDSRYGATRYFDRSPDTTSEYYDQMAWERDPDVDFIYLPTTPGGTPTLTELVPSRTMVFALEVRDSANDLVDTIPQYFKGSMKQIVDRASELRFTVAGTHAIVPDLAPPNQIWVRDRWGLVLDTFRIRQVKKRREGDAIFVDVFGQSALVALAQEPVKDYSTGRDEAYEPVEDTVGDIVAALLALQVQSPAITLGTIDRAIRDYALTFYATDTTVLGALSDLQAQLPRDFAGHFYIDGRGRLQWRLQIGSHRAESIALGEALQGIEYDIDYEDTFTRAYVYGEGDDPSTRLSLVDAGEAEEYLEDATAVGTYGVIPRVIVQKDIRYAPQLLALAQRLLEEFANPVVTVSVDGLDLAKADGARFPDTNDLYIGSDYIATDAAQGISATINVTALEWNFDTPVAVKIELRNRRRSLADLLASLLRPQPLDVNGDRYPNMGRNYTSPPADPTYRAGDLRYNSGAEMYSGSGWLPFAIMYEQAGEPASGENANFWYETDTHYLYYKSNGTWLNISHFTE